MEKKLAFAFSGGGSREAMQAGALHTLLEACYLPAWYRQFVMANGLALGLRLKDLIEMRLYPAAADLNAGCLVVFRLNPEDAVLECVLAFMSLPP